MTKWSLKEAVSVGSLDKHLLKFKDPIKGKLQGNLGEYVDILEFVIDWFANRTGGSDADFDAFMKKLTASYDSSEIGRETTFSAKKKKEKEIEAEPAIDVDTDIEPVGVHNPKTKVHPPPLPKNANAPEKEKKPAFGSAPNAPSLGSLAAKEKGDKEDDTDMWDKATQTAKDLHAKMPQNPKIEPDSLPPDEPGKPKRFKSGSSQDWQVGKTVDVGFNKDLLIKGKKGKFWHLVGSKGQEYVFEPHQGLKKFTKAG